MRGTSLLSKLNPCYPNLHFYLPLFRMVLPTTNKALRFSSLGGDLEILEKQVPPLPANELLVKVHAASINPCDIQLWRSGLVAVVAGDKGMGKDFSGTVVGVGSNVNGWAEGDEIFGLLFHVVCSSFLLLDKESY
jgi:NADPH:quinone reductase-like Zn-dependent oxidoreductase